MEIINLQSREVFGSDGRGIAAVVEEPNLKIDQIGLELGKAVPVHKVDASMTIQVVRGEGLFFVGGESVRVGPGKLLRIPMGSSLGIMNDSEASLVFLVIKTPQQDAMPRQSFINSRAGVFVNNDSLLAATSSIPSFDLIAGFYKSSVQVKTGDTFGSYDLSGSYDLCIFRFKVPVIVDDKNPGMIIELDIFIRQFKNS